MKKRHMLPILAGFAAALLVGCGAAGPTQPAPEASTLGIAELPTDIPPTAQAALPPREPAPFPTIDSLGMVDQANGWASDTEGKLYRTADSGASWYLISTPADVQVDAYASAFLDASHAWLSTYDATGAPGLLRTSDGGATWTPLTDNGLGEFGGQAGFEFSTPDDGLATVAGVGAGNLYLRVFETHDGGASFQVIPLVGPTDEQGLPEGTLHLCSLCLDAFHYNPYRAIIVEGDMGTMQPRGAVHVQTSTDLGQHWTEMALPLPAGYEDALVSGLPLSFPGGQHGFLPVRLMKYNADGSTAYDVVALYTTPDGGTSWTLRPAVLSGITNHQTLQFPTDLDAIAACGPDLCFTRDEAYTWQTLTPSIDLSVSDARHILQMSFVNPLNGWILLLEDERHQLYQTADGGESWTLLNP